MRSWVRAQGIAPVEELSDWVERFLRNRPDGGRDCRCIAFFTDRCAGARGEHIPALLADAGTLLELRLFDEAGELWCHRSMLMESFACRQAEDAGVGPKYMLSSSQYMDIAEELGPDGRGCMRLRSTAGSHFGLPIDSGDRRVRLVAYVAYDEQSGCAHIADYRIAGFAPEEGGDRR